MKRYYLPLLGIAAVAFAWTAHSDAGGDTKSASKVKASVEASKVEKDGKQTVTITLAIAKGWHLYANPVNATNEFLEQSQTTVKVKGKVSDIRVKYPEGRTYTDKQDKFDIYEGTVKIPVTLKRKIGDTSPLEINVTVNACDKSTCLIQSTIKLTVK